VAQGEGPEFKPQDSKKKKKRKKERKEKEKGPVTQKAGGMQRVLPGVMEEDIPRHWDGTVALYSARYIHFNIVILLINKDSSF
jgi:hypothetical protein